MDQNNSSSNHSCEPRPPPYNTQFDGASPYTGVSYQVGKCNVAVISPPSTYDNIRYPVEAAAAGGDQQFVSAPPDYSPGLEDNVFSDAVIRRGFIRKVYLTLMIQLLVTVGIICAFLYWEALREWARDTVWFFTSMIVVTVVLVLVLACCGDLRRKVPLNFIFLALFTVAEGLMLGSLAAYLTAEAVLWAVGATALVSFAVTLFAMQSKWDFTGLNGSLWVFLWTLLSFALLCAILRSQYLHILYASLGTLLFSLYLVYDTQLILGGKNRKQEVSPEEYVFAALTLYLDIVTVLLFMLKFMVLCR